jgi:hypothetical protein
LWAVRCCTGPTAQGEHIAIDATNNIYITGKYFAGSYTFGADVLTNAGNTDAFLAKYNSTGSAIWAKRIGSSKEEYIGGIAISSSGTLYITGYFSSSSVAIGTITLTQNGNYNTFVASYTSGGTAVWARVSTSANTVTSGGIVTADCIGCTGNSSLCDNIYVSGTLVSNAAMYFGSVGFTPYSGGDNSWFAVFSSAGTPLAGLVKPFGGQDANALGMDVYRHLYLAGDYACGNSAVMGSDTLYCSGTNDNPFTSQLELEGCTSTLPVTFTSFTAEMTNHKCQLRWSTASEINNDFFTVERSKDGKEFYPLLTIDSKAASGNSTTPLDYDASDEKPFNALSYYRLKQTDLDGHKQFSEIVAIRNSDNAALSVYPNPAHNSFTVSFGDELKMDNAVLKIVDLTGRVVHEQAIHNSQAEINSLFLPGIYFIKVRAAENTYLQKLTIE